MDSSTCSYGHLHKSLFQLSYKFCIFYIPVSGHGHFQGLQVRFKLLLLWVAEVFFSRAAGCFGVSHMLKSWAAKPWGKPLVWSDALYCPCWTWSFFIGLHLNQWDWTSPTLIIWIGAWSNAANEFSITDKQKSNNFDNSQNSQCNISLHF